MVRITSFKKLILIWVSQPKIRKRLQEEKPKFRRYWKLKRQAIWLKFCKLSKQTSRDYAKKQAVKKKKSKIRSLQSYEAEQQKSWDNQIISPIVTTAKKTNQSSELWNQVEFICKKNKCQMPNVELLLDKVAGNQNKFHVKEKDSFQHWVSVTHINESNWITKPSSSATAS